MEELKRCPFGGDCIAYLCPFDGDCIAYQVFDLVDRKEFCRTETAKRCR